MKNTSLTPRNTNSNNNNPYAAVCTPTLRRVPPSMVHRHHHSNINLNPNTNTNNTLQGQYYAHHALANANYRPQDEVVSDAYQQYYYYYYLQEQAKRQLEVSRQNNNNNNTNNNNTSFIPHHHHEFHQVPQPPYHQNNNTNNNKMNSFEEYVYYNSNQYNNNNENNNPYYFEDGFEDSFSPQEYFTAAARHYHRLPPYSSEVYYHPEYLPNYNNQNQNNNNNGIIPSMLKPMPPPSLPYDHYYNNTINNNNNNTHSDITTTSTILTLSSGVTLTPLTINAYAEDHCLLCGDSAHAYRSCGGYDGHLLCLYAQKEECVYVMRHADWLGSATLEDILLFVETCMRCDRRDVDVWVDGRPFYKLITSDNNNKNKSNNNKGKLQNLLCSERYKQVRCVDVRLLPGAVVFVSPKGAWNLPNSSTTNNNNNNTTLEGSVTEKKEVDISNNNNNGKEETHATAEKENRMEGHNVKEVNKENKNHHKPPPEEASNPPPTSKDLHRPPLAPTTHNHNNNNKTNVEEKSTPNIITNVNTNVVPPSLAERPNSWDTLARLLKLNLSGGCTLAVEKGSTKLVATDLTNNNNNNNNVEEKSNKTIKEKEETTAPREKELYTPKTKNNNYNGRQKKEPFSKKDATPVQEKENEKNETKPKSTVKQELQLEENHHNNKNEDNNHPETKERDGYRRPYQRNYRHNYYYRPHQRREERRWGRHEEEEEEEAQVAEEESSKAPPESRDHWIEETKEEREDRRCRTIFIKYVSPHWPRRNLRNLFIKYGEVHRVRLVRPNLRHNEEGDESTEKGFYRPNRKARPHFYFCMCFVEYATRKEAQAAMSALRSFPMGGGYYMETQCPRQAITGGYLTDYDKRTGKPCTFGLYMGEIEAIHKKYRATVEEEEAELCWRREEDGFTLQDRQKLYREGEEDGVHVSTEESREDKGDKEPQPQPDDHNAVRKEEKETKAVTAPLSAVQTPRSDVSDRKPHPHKNRNKKEKNQNDNNNNNVTYNNSVGGTTPSTGERRSGHKEKLNQEENINNNNNKKEEDVIVVPAEIHPNTCQEKVVVDTPLEVTPLIDRHHQNNNNNNDSADVVVEKSLSPLSNSSAVTVPFQCTPSKENEKEESSHTSGGASLFLPGWSEAQLGQIASLQTLLKDTLKSYTQVEKDGATFATALTVLQELSMLTPAVTPLAPRPTSPNIILLKMHSLVTQCALLVCHDGDNDGRLAAEGVQDMMLWAHAFVRTMKDFSKHIKNRNPNPNNNNTSDSSSDTSLSLNASYLRDPSWWSLFSAIPLPQQLDYYENKENILTQDALNDCSEEEKKETENNTDEANNNNNNKEEEALMHFVCSRPFPRIDVCYCFIQRLLQVSLLLDSFLFSKGLQNNENENNNREEECDAVRGVLVSLVEATRQVIQQVMKVVSLSENNNHHHQKKEKSISKTMEHFFDAVLLLLPNGTVILKDHTGGTVWETYLSHRHHENETNNNNNEIILKYAERLLCNEDSPISQLS